MKNILFWFLAIVITLTAAIYQRTTGPTYEKMITFSHNNFEYKIELLRSHSTSKPAPVILEVSDITISGNLYYKKYPTNDDFTMIELTRVNEVLKGTLPNQPPAGKLEYYVSLYDVNTEDPVIQSEHVIIRFKGDVPSSVLTPHIFIMFFAMLLSNYSGILAVAKKEKYKLYGIITLLFLTIGGMILGPIVQKFAFGDLWTGIPFGWDLTDNKTLVAFIFWIIAVVGNWKKDRPYLTVLAAIIMLIIFSIPHSAFGSELDYSSGTIGQG
jgi:hypothetical protein